MDMKTKLEIVERAIASIATHEDEDATLRSYALDRVSDMVSKQRGEMQKRVEARIKETMGKS